MHENNPNHKTENIFKFVETEGELPNFAISEFCEEINELLSVEEYHYARKITRMAIKKIILTPKHKFNKASDRKYILDRLDDILNSIEEKSGGSYNLYPSENEELFLAFPYISISEVIHTYKIETFEEIEKRLFKEGFLDNFDYWKKENEALITLINSLYSNGFFKSRKKNGCWIHYNFYMQFFEFRYDVALIDSLNTHGIMKDDYQGYFSWLQEYYDLKDQSNI